MNRPDQPDPHDGEEPGRGPRDGDRQGDHRTPRIPAPRSPVEDGGLPLPQVPGAPPHHVQDARDNGDGGSRGDGLDHHVLKSLLGAWALSACSAPEATAVEEHLGTCGPCAEEALRLRDAVGLLHPEESLDLDPGLRTRVLESCLGRRPPRIPLPEWAAPYDAETARLDALLRDIGDAEWHAPVRLRWFEDDVPVNRKTTVAGVIAHLLAVDGLVGAALGLTDPLGVDAPPVPDPTRRTETFWGASRFPPTRAVREPWRDQTHELIRTVSFAGGGSGRLGVEYGVAGARGAEGCRTFTVPLRDSMVERAFECWIHAEDIAEAVDYPYEPPSPRHLHHMIDLAARMLPVTLAERRRAGRAAPSRELVAAGAPGRSLRLEVEGVGGGEWFIPLDSPGASGSAECEVAHIALDGVEFCRLAAGHVAPEEAAAGQMGDREAIRDVLFAAASLSRL
ncbi:MDMPI N domain containing protein [Streptomyces sp. p1417]|uniref:MDMPI N domain containing protein n=1 Tax=Streptomyces typhae TaxID=2681492 RepID=A0A6L6WUY3_9ACTN|nr:MDMPI N domain containing protein [Streptomyces typhae]